MTRNINSLLKKDKQTQITDSCLAAHLSNPTSESDVNVIVVINIMLTVSFVELLWLEFYISCQVKIYLFSNLPI